MQKASPSVKDLGVGAGPTIVNLDFRLSPEEQEDAMPAPVADVAMDGDEDDLSVSSPATIPKKRGRPPRSMISTTAAPVSSKTPQSKKSTGRKRKAADLGPKDMSETQPTTANHKRPARATGVAARARLANKVAEKASRSVRKRSPTVSTASLSPRATDKTGTQLEISMSV